LSPTTYFKKKGEKEAENEFKWRLSILFKKDYYVDSSAMASLTRISEFGSSLKFAKNMT